MRGATLVLGHPLGAKVISIHAPHAERDLLPLVLFAHFSFCALVCLCFAEGGLRRCIAE